MALSWRELERTAEVMLDAYPTPSRLTQLVEYSLSETLSHVVSAHLPLREQVFELLRWAGRQGRLVALLRYALDDKSGNPRLADVVPSLLARLAGEPAIGERPEAPEIAADGMGRGVMLIAAREHAQLLADLEDALRALGGSDLVTVVARRYLDPDQASPAPHPQLHLAQAVVILAGRDLTTSSYLWSAEASELLDRHYDRRLLLIPVQLGGLIHARSKLAGLPVIDGHGPGLHDAAGTQIDVAALAARIADALSAGTERRASAPSLDDYVSELDARLAELDRDVDGFVEPTKAIAAHRNDRRPRGRTRTTSATLPEILADHATHRAVAVLGEPGSGKSLLLRQLARHHLARLARGDRHALVPVYVKLATYTDRDGGRPAALLDFLRRSLATGPARERYVARELDVLLAERRLLVLLDGMDEMPRADFAARAARARQLVDRHQCRVVLTCRERDFERAQLPVLEVRVRPFSNRQIAAHLVTVVGCSAPVARQEARVLTALHHPLAHVIRNPLNLGLVARQRAIDGVYPAVVGDLFRGFTERALDPGVTQLDPAALRVDLATIAFEMAVLDSPGTAVPLAELMVALAGKTKLAVPRAIEGAVASGLVRRDDSTGALLFSHARIQERFIAIHLVRLEPGTRQAWLEMHAAEVWFDEIYILAAREGLDCRGLFAWVARGVSEFLAAVSEQSLARETLLEEHEHRLVLLGRVAESAALDAGVVAHIAELLARLWHAADRYMATGRTRVAVLQAARAELLACRALHDVVIEGASSRHAALRREAWCALASHHETSTVRRLVLRQAVSTHYLRHVHGDQRLAATEPRLSRLARWSLTTLALHLGLIALSILLLALSATALPTGNTQINTQILVAVVLISAYVIGTSLSQDGEPSTLRLLVNGWLAGLSFRVAAVLPEFAARTSLAICGSDSDPIASLAPLQNGIVVASTVAAMACAIAAMFGPVRRLLDDLWQSVFAFAMAGALAAAWSQSELHTPRWTLATAAALSGLVIIAWIRAELPNLRRRRSARQRQSAQRVEAGTPFRDLGLAPRLIFAAFLLGMVLLFLSYLWKSAHETLMGSGGLLLFGSLVGVAVWFLYHNARVGATLAMRKPCSLAEAREHLRVLTSQGVLIDAARAWVFERLQSVTPLSRVLELALTEIASVPRWGNYSQLALALRELARRRARSSPGELATIDDEIAMLSAAKRLDEGAIARQWLLELAPEQREAIRSRAATIPRAVRTQLDALHAEPHA